MTFPNPGANTTQPYTDAGRQPDRARYTLWCRTRNLKTQAERIATDL